MLLVCYDPSTKLLEFIYLTTFQVIITEECIFKGQAAHKVLHLDTQCSQRTYKAYLFHLMAFYEEDEMNNVNHPCLTNNHKIVIVLFDVYRLILDRFEIG